MRVPRGGAGRTAQAGTLRGARSAGATPQVATTATPSPSSLSSTPTPPPLARSWRRRHGPTTRRGGRQQTARPRPRRRRRRSVGWRGGTEACRVGRGPAQRRDLIPHRPRASTAEGRTRRGEGGAGAALPPHAPAATAAVRRGPAAAGARPARRRAPDTRVAHPHHGAPSFVRGRGTGSRVNPARTSPLDPTRCRPTAGGLGTVHVVNGGLVGGGCASEPWPARSLVSRGPTGATVAPLDLRRAHAAGQRAAETGQGCTTPVWLGARAHLARAECVLTGQTVAPDHTTRNKWHHEKISVRVAAGHFFSVVSGCVPPKRK